MRDSDGTGLLTLPMMSVADAHYPAGARIRIVLDNHSAHISKETQAFLGTRPNRFEFTFTPKHGSWLNLIESFFAKLARTLLRGIRAASADELKARIELYLKEVNETPVVYRWKYKPDTLSVVQLLLLQVRITLLDVVGHYARPDVFHLAVNESELRSVQFGTGTERPEG